MHKTLKLTIASIGLVLFTIGCSIEKEQNAVETEFMNKYPNTELTKIHLKQGSAGTAMTFHLYYKVADGSERTSVWVALYDQQDKLQITEISHDNN